MSLEGLDSVLLSEAFDGAQSDPGGWFWIKYVSRDEVELLGSGKNGAGEMREAAIPEPDDSPLFGFIRFRRRNVLVKYVPSGCSRVLMARSQVHFQLFAERCSPYDSTLAIASPAELNEQTLNANCSTHTATGSISSSSSLRSRRLTDIAENPDEGGDEAAKHGNNNNNINNNPYYVPSTPRLDYFDDGCGSSASAATTAAKENSGLTNHDGLALSVVVTSHGDTGASDNGSVGVPVIPDRDPTVSSHFLSKGDFPSANNLSQPDSNEPRRKSTSSASSRPSASDLYNYYPYVPKVKLGPRPHVEPPNKQRPHSSSNDRSKTFPPSSSSSASNSSSSVSNNSLSLSSSSSASSSSSSSSSSSNNAHSSSSSSLVSQSSLSASSLSVSSTFPSSSSSSAAAARDEELRASVPRSVHLPPRRTASSSRNAGSNPSLAALNIPEPQLPPSPTTPSSLYSFSIYSSNSTASVKTASEGPTPEKQRLMKALQLRKQKQNTEPETPSTPTFDNSLNTNALLSPLQQHSPATAFVSTTSAAPEQLSSVPTTMSITDDAPDAMHPVDNTSVAQTVDHATGNTRLQDLGNDDSVSGGSDDTKESHKSDDMEESGEGSTEAETEGSASGKGDDDCVAAEPESTVENTEDPASLDSEVDKIEGTTKVRDDVDEEESDGESIVSLDQRTSESSKSSSAAASVASSSRSSTHQSDRRVSNAGLSANGASKSRATPTEAAAESARPSPFLKPAKPVTAKKVSVGGSVSQRIRQFQQLATNVPAAAAGPFAPSAFTAAGRPCTPTRSRSNSPIPDFLSTRPPSSMSNKSPPRLGSISHEHPPLPALTPSISPATISSRNSMLMPAANISSTPHNNRYSMPAQPHPKDMAPPPKPVRAKMEIVEMDNKTHGLQVTTKINWDGSHHDVTSPNISPSSSLYRPSLDMIQSPTSDISPVELPGLRNELPMRRDSVSHHSRSNSSKSNSRDISPKSPGLLQRMSSTLSRKTKEASPPRPPVPVESATKKYLHTGSINVQLPDTMLWKRRYMKIDSDGWLCLSLTDDENAPQTRKYHIASEVRKIDLPDVDEQELPYSVRLMLREGGMLQCACQNSAEQKQVLGVVRSCLA